MVIPTPGFFLVLASRLMYENKAYRWSITCTTLVSLLVFPLLRLEGWPSALYNL